MKITKKGVLNSDRLGYGNSYTEELGVCLKLLDSYKPICNGHHKTLPMSNQIYIDINIYLSEKKNRFHQSSSQRPPVCPNKSN